MARVIGVAAIIAAAWLGFVAARSAAVPPADAQQASCGQFASQAAAQAAYRANPGGLSELDRDRDGVACEENAPPCDLTPVMPAGGFAATPPARLAQCPVIAAQPSPVPTPVPAPAAAAMASTTQRLVQGCNNVVAPASESVAQVAVRVDPASAVTAIWRQVPGSATFRGSPVPAPIDAPPGVVDLTAVAALDAIFICVTAPATYRLG